MCTYIFLGSFPLIAQTRDAKAHADNGIAFARARNWPDAERELRAAVQSAPQVAAYRAQLGSILGLQGKWKEALASFQKAVDLDSEKLAYRRETAAVELQLGALDSAEKNLRYLLEKLPGDPESTVLLALVAESRGEFKKAAGLFDSQFEIAVADPDRTTAFFHAAILAGQKDPVSRIIGLLRTHQGDKQWANALLKCAQIAIAADDLQVSNDVLELIPQDSVARANLSFELAKSRYRSGQISQAIDLLLPLADRNPSNAEVLTFLGNCYEAQRKPEFALQAYRRAVQIDPSNIAPYEDLISLQLDMGQTAEAIALANSAVEAAPQNALAWVVKGNVQLRTYAYKDALESYGHGSKLDPANAEAVLGLAGAKSLAGRNDAAIAEYKSAIARFPDDARFYIACAELLMASPDAIRLRPEAETLLNKAVRLNPQSPQAYYQLGQLALQDGRLEQAESDFLQSLKSAPYRSATHFALSQVYRRIGRTDDASKQFAMFQSLKSQEENESSLAATAAGKP